MFGDHFLQQLAPREWAAQTLDAVREGADVPAALVDRALHITGDLSINDKNETPWHDTPTTHRFRLLDLDGTN